MAPSKRVLIICLLAIAVVAAAVQPSEATGEKGKGKSAANKGKEASSQPLIWRPRLPYRPPKHCIPAGRPRHPFLPPCPSGSPPSPSASPPEPSECYTPLKEMLPCADFLTKRTGVRAPPSECCDGLKALVKDAPVCMCHVVNNDFSKMLPAPMLRLRMMMLPRVCHVAFPRATLRQCIAGHVPPMDTPAPTPAATPPESPSSPPPAATPPESPSTPPAPDATPPESPSTPPPAATPPATPSTPPAAAATPPESPSAAPPTPTSKPPASI